MAPILPFIIMGVASVVSAGVKIAAANKNKRFLNEQIEEERERRGDLLRENRRKFALIGGAQRAGLIAGGLEITGTVLDVLGDTAVQEARNKAALQREAGQRIKGLRNQIGQQDQVISGALISGAGGIAQAGLGAMDRGLLGGNAFDLGEAAETSDLSFNRSTGTFTY